MVRILLYVCMYVMICAKTNIPKIVCMLFRELNEHKLL